MPLTHDIIIGSNMSEMLNATAIATSITQKVTIINASWVLPLIITLVLLTIITRDINKWKILALPVTAILHIIGLKVSLLQYIITVLLFAMEALSAEGVEALLRTAKKRLTRKTAEQSQLLKRTKDVKIRKGVEALSVREAKDIERLGSGEKLGVAPWTRKKRIKAREEAQETILTLAREREEANWVKQLKEALKRK